jgi:hypothetical protein
MRHHVSKARVIPSDNAVVLDLHARLLAGDPAEAVAFRERAHAEAERLFAEAIAAAAEEFRRSPVYSDLRQLEGKHAALSQRVEALTAESAQADVELRTAIESGANTIPDLRDRRDLLAIDAEDSREVLEDLERRLTATRDAADKSWRAVVSRTHVHVIEQAVQAGKVALQQVLDLAVSRLVEVVAADLVAAQDERQTQARYGALPSGEPLQPLPTPEPVAPVEPESPRRRRAVAMRAG